MSESKLIDEVMATQEPWMTGADTIHTEVNILPAAAGHPAILAPMTDDSPLDSICLEDGTITTHTNYETFIGNDDEGLTERVRLLLVDHYADHPEIEVLAYKNPSNPYRTLLMVRSIKRHTTTWKMVRKNEIRNGE